MRRCDALLAISAHAGNQAMTVMGADCPAVTPIWGGPYPSGAFPAFEKQQDDAAFTLPATYVLVVGGDHPRKNLDRLIQAWAQVPADLRTRVPLVLACRLNPGTVRRLHAIARRAGLAKHELVLTGGVSETTLQRLYVGAQLLVFPSLEEGLGMPPLEAMAAGCPTLLARGSSLSELSELDAAFFDGLDAADMAATITRALTDEALHGALRRAAAVSAERFTRDEQCPAGLEDALRTTRCLLLTRVRLPGPHPTVGHRGDGQAGAIPSAGQAGCPAVSRGSRRLRSADRSTPPAHPRLRPARRRPSRGSRHCRRRRGPADARVRGTACDGCGSRSGAGNRAAARWRACRARGP